MKAATLTLALALAVLGGGVAHAEGEPDTSYLYDGGAVPLFWIPARGRDRHRLRRPAALDAAAVRRERRRRHAGRVGDPELDAHRHRRRRGHPVSRRERRPVALVPRQGPRGVAGDQRARRLDRQARVRTPSPGLERDEHRSDEGRVVSVGARDEGLRDRDLHRALSARSRRRRPRPRARGMFGAAVLVDTERVYHDRHYVSDVAAGSLLGAASSYLIYRYQDARVRPPNPRLGDRPVGRRAHVHPLHHGQLLMSDTTFGPTIVRR